MENKLKNNNNKKKIQLLECNKQLGTPELLISSAKITNLPVQECYNRHFLVDSLTQLSIIIIG